MRRNLYDISKLPWYRKKLRSVIRATEIDSFTDRKVRRMLTDENISERKIKRILTRLYKILGTGYETSCEHMDIGLMNLL
ncbi:MAG: hypothetical protein SPI86_01070 [Treponemataceae bacterium]|nr:hypothetical protein [Spirochaetales bacterium]MDY6030331.1 hypothetical protein [Treponemataceae bacterium]